MISSASSGPKAARGAGSAVEGRGWGRGQLWPVAFLREGIARQPVKPLRQVARVERRPFELRALRPERGKRGRLARAVPQQQIGGLFGRNHRILAARHRAAMAATAAEGRQEFAQLRAQSGNGVGDPGAALTHRVAPDLQRVRQIAQRDLRAVAIECIPIKECQQILRHIRQLLGSARGQRHDARLLGD